MTNISIKQTTPHISIRASGKQGIQGEKGDTGATGPQGPKGDPGTTDYNELENLPDLTLKADKATTYTKTEVDTALTGKANAVHTHVASDVTDFDSEVSSNADVSANTAARHTHANKSILDATSASYTTADETKLDGIEAGAQVNTVTSVAGKTGAVTLGKGDVGLSNVDNTSDANKPISTATQAALDAKATTAALDAHANSTTNPHQVTKAQVGLGNVDNTSDANKPVSTATQIAINTKTSKGELVLNVKDFGAVGDGITDDTTAMQDAIDAAVNGGIVFVPEGTYIVDPSVSLNLTSGITFSGTGYKSILKIKDIDVLDNLVKVENADDVILKDFAIDGDRVNKDPSDLVSVNYGVYVAASNNVRVERVKVYSTTGVGIHIYNSVGTVVTDCESYGNRYHGFECEQCTSTTWSNNRGHSNTRHGIFISPGEVGGTGSIGNVITSNSFDNNDSYGIAFGIDAAGLSIGLTKDNIVSNNSVVSNGEYGINIYRVDDVTVTNNIIAYNGFFGLYIYRGERNQVISNRFRNNSQIANGAYDEILLEGANDGQSSQHNIISNNFIYIDGANKANYAIREATTSDGPNVIQSNYIPSAGVSGRTLIQHVNTRYSIVSDTPESNTESFRTFDDGIAIAANAALPGSTMGIDAPFGTAVLRLINQNPGGNFQLVTPNGNTNIWAGGSNVADFTSSGLQINSGSKITSAGDIDVTDHTSGVILTSPNAARWRVTADNSGNLTTTAI